MRQTLELTLEFDSKADKDAWIRQHTDVVRDTVDYSSFTLHALPHSSAYRVERLENRTEEDASEYGDRD